MRRQDVVSPRGGIIRHQRRPAGWQPSGPAPAPPAIDDDTLEPGPDEDLCWLAGNWRIFQRTDGHRFSLDDVLTAAMAAAAFDGRRPPARVLDLGCGIGSVLLFLAWRFPTARLVGIEAQPVSAALARRSIRVNGIEARCTVLDGDFRDQATRIGLPMRDVCGENDETSRSEPQPFDLISGTPPYFPAGTGVESSNVQRGPCRFEHRGGVEAYCETAVPLLAPGAPLVLCVAPGQVERLETFAPQVGLEIETRQDIVPRAGKAPLFSLFTLRAVGRAAPFTDLPPLLIRDADGARTPAFIAIRAAMGMPP